MGLIPYMVRASFPTFCPHHLFSDVNVFQNHLQIPRSHHVSFSFSSDSPSWTPRLQPNFFPWGLRNRSLVYFLAPVLLFMPFHSPGALCTRGKGHLFASAAFLSITTVPILQCYRQIHLPCEAFLDCSRRE